MRIASAQYLARRNCKIRTECNNSARRSQILPQQESLRSNMLLSDKGYPGAGSGELQVAHHVMDHPHIAPTLPVLVALGRKIPLHQIMSLDLDKALLGEHHERDELRPLFGVAPVLFGSLPHRPIGPGVVDRRCHECIRSDLAPRELLMQAYLAWKVFEIEAQIMTPILEGRNDIQNHSRIGISVGFSDQYGLGSTVFFRKLPRRHGLLSIRFAKLW